VSQMRWKFFFSVLKFYLSKSYNNPPLIKPWIEILVRIVMQPIPDGMQPADESLRPQFCWWVLKKWAMKILYRMANRHGIPGDIRIPPESPSDDVIHYEQVLKRIGTQKKCSQGLAGCNRSKVLGCSSSCVWSEKRLCRIL
jgi:hypothetical protein